MRSYTVVCFSSNGSRENKGGGFTLTEVMVASAAAALIGAVVLTSLSALRKTFFATESYSRDYATQVRLLDYVSRDLLASGTNNVRVGSTVLAPRGGYTAVNAASGTLTIPVPAYYASGSTGVLTTSTLGFDGNNVYYGSGTNTTVSYYKANDSVYGNNCYIRSETGGNRLVIADHADGVLLELRLSGTIPASQYQVRVRFNPVFTGGGTPSEPVVNGTNGLSAAQLVSIRKLNE